MGAKLRTTVDEYLYLKKRIEKLKEEAKTIGPVLKKRLFRKIRKLQKRMAVIKDFHREEGLPHPESFTPEARERERRFNDTTSWYGNRMDPMNCKSTTTADGELFRTPILPGATLDPFFYSQDKIDEYLKEPEE